MIHKPGKANVVPDAISRLQHSVSNISTGAYDPARISKLQRADPELHQLISYLESGQPYQMEVTSEVAQQKSNNFFLDATNVLYRMNQPDHPYHTAKLLVIPSSLKEEILIACHDHPLSGHLGFDKTLHKIQDRYW